MLDPNNMNFFIYLLLKLTPSREPEPEPKLQYSGSSSGKKFRLWLHKHCLEDCQKKIFAATYQEDCQKRGGLADT